MVSRHDQHTQMTTQQVLHSFIAGGTAGVASKTIVAPIERIKYLYLDFAVFDYLRRRFYKKDNTLHSQIVLFLCGATAGCASITLIQPLDFLRIQLSMEKDSFTYGGIREALSRVYNRQGLRGFYAGYPVSIIGIIFYHGTGFFLYTKVKQYIHRKFPSYYTKWYTDFLAGFITGAGQFITYPLDMIKKRKQGLSLLVERKQIPRILGYRELLRKMSGEGIRAFYKGFTVNIIKTPLAMAVSWTVKNNLNRLMDKTYDF